ncbi:uncharacterized protein N0V89_001596 [Didymosphaeria variabile]|uniref:F-box domain-containing protein n=1 Tax=Didymosphaeria variabile TaxID=1932322 RepID=A0A9W8XWG3_9PLEO|nr:uncharacterized protein N0V89_001596 [Didymosphaeria variabile]KAJ4361027.1 hypothetical protein N0V89_001596 [Didymosphaeria variabile]
MDSLPQELVERICGLLTRNDLKNTLTLSRSFQYASERASGAYTTFDLNSENTQDFKQLYAGRRWAYLRHVRYQTHIPAYDAETEDDEYYQKHHCRESSQELQKKDEQFTEQIKDLFDTLKLLEGNASEGKLQVTIYAPVREVREASPHRKCISWRLHLLSPESLPSLGSVRALRIEDPRIIFPLDDDKSLLKIDLRVIVDLAVKFPHLEYLGCKLFAGSGWTPYYNSEAPRTYSREWPGPLRDTRLDFAKAIEDANLPATLREAQLDFLWPMTSAERIDHDERIPNLVGSNAYDPFSNSLRSLSHRLRRLELKAVADASLFWPSNGSASYPNLESVCIVFHMSTPAGRWYFDGPEDLGHDIEGTEVNERSYPPLEDTADDKALDEEVEDDGLDIEVVNSKQFRVRPNDDVLTPFLTAFAKAAAEMPKLKEACLWCPLRWQAGDSYGNSDELGKDISKWPDRPLAWGITYIAPKTFGFHFEGQHFSQSRQLFWTTGPWRPSNELHDLFGRIGDQNAELLEYWGLENYGKDKLALRDVFDQFQIYGRRHPGCAWPIDKSFIVHKTLQ